MTPLLSKEIAKMLKEGQFSTKFPRSNHALHAKPKIIHTTMKKQVSLKKTLAAAVTVFIVSGCSSESEGDSSNSSNLITEPEISEPEISNPSPSDDGNQAPAPTADSIYTDANTPGTSRIYPNDPNPEQHHVFFIDKPPLHGNATIDPTGLIVYSPAENHAGYDSISIQVTDDGSPPLSVSTPVDIFVFRANSPPVPSALNIEIESDQIGFSNIDVYDPDTEDVHQFSILSPPMNGTASVDSFGLLTYTPSENFYGKDSITINVQDDGTPPLTTAISINVDISPPSYTIVHNPYLDVLWEADFRLKAQHHDHIGIDTKKIQAYDEAGYKVVSLLQYSGVRSLEYTWLERRWPPESWVNQYFINRLRNIEIFLPNAEEVGHAHITSPFLKRYIEKWEPSYNQRRQSWHYSSTQECIDKIKSHGGLAILAHPWNKDSSQYLEIDGYSGIEIYSAFARHEQEKSIDPFFTLEDRNQIMLDVWDKLLTQNPRILGIAVNDHYGPYNKSVTLSPKTKDSGKIIVLAKSTHSLEEYQRAFSMGSFFAVMDIGTIKDRYPEINSINIQSQSISIDTSDEVSWISSGEVLHIGSELPFILFSEKTNYVRAEVKNSVGSTVYTQAFSIGRRINKSKRGQGF